MKICSKCAISKDESDYFVKDKKSGRLHAHCKQCYKEHRKSYYAEHYEKYRDDYRIRARSRRLRVKRDLRTRLVTYMSDKACQTCGESDICVLEFDHLDPSDKRFGIAWGVANGYKWETILQEIDKCRVLCANCHKRHTAKQQGWFKALQQ